MLLNALVLAIYQEFGVLIRLRKFFPQAFGSAQSWGIRMFLGYYEDRLTRLCVHEWA